MTRNHRNTLRNPRKVEHMLLKAADMFDELAETTQGSDNITARYYWEDRADTMRKIAQYCLPVIVGTMYNLPEDQVYE